MQILFYMALLVSTVVLILVAIKGFQELMRPIKLEAAAKKQQQQQS